MKQLFVVVLLFCICVSCNQPLTPNAKLLNAIHEYLKKNLNDYSSYELIENIITPVYYERRDISYSDYHYYSRQRQAIAEREQFIKDSIARYRMNNPNDTSYKLNTLPDSLNNSNRIIGWIVDHKFRSKNGFGAMVISFLEFRFDSAFNIIGVEDINSIYDPPSNY